MIRGSKIKKDFKIVINNELNNNKLQIFGV